MDRNTASVRPSPPATDATTADVTRTAPPPVPPTSVHALRMASHIRLDSPLRRIVTLAGALKQEPLFVL